MLSDDFAMLPSGAVTEGSYRQFAKQWLDIIPEIATDSVNDKGPGQAGGEAGQQFFPVLFRGRFEPGDDAQAVAIDR